MPNPTSFRTFVLTGLASVACLWLLTLGVTIGLAFQAIYLMI